MKYSILTNFLNIFTFVVWKNKARRPALHSGILAKWEKILQSLMNVKLGQQPVRPCHANGLVKTIPSIPHNLSICKFQVVFPYSEIC